MARIQLSAPFFTKEEENAVRNVITSGWISNGPWRTRATEELKTICKRKYCVLTCNGTMALTAAITIMGSQKPGKIAVPAMCWPGVAQAVEQCGHTPVGVDIDSYYQMSVDWLDEASVSACIAVDSYGGMPYITMIEEICRRKGIPLIEDAAEAFGATSQDRPAGNFGDVSIFSFFANKIVTAGEGGALLTDDPILYEMAKAFIDFGRTTTTYHGWQGTNGHITELQSAVLAMQLEKREQLIRMRREIQWWYDQLIPAENRQVHRMRSTGVPWLYCLMTKGAEKRDAVLSALAAADIEARPFFPPLSDHKGILAHQLREKFFVKAVEIAAGGLCLPMHPRLTQSNVSEICEIVNKVIS